MNEDLVELFGVVDGETYRNLSGIKLSGAARKYLCEMINGSHGVVSKLTVCGAASRYKISRNTVKSWYSRFLSGNAFYDCKGRPPALDDESLQSLRLKVPSTPDSEATDDVDLLIENEKLETRKRRRPGIASYTVSHDFLCPATLKKLKCKLKDS
jgi:hypothetical protein